MNSSAYNDEEKAEIERHDDPDAKYGGPEARMALERKLLWKIEEHETTISPACPKHIGKIGGEGKGIAHEHTRDIGEAELKSGWKTDWDEGQLEGDFPVAINTSMKPNCDVNSPDGLQIKHTLKKPLNIILFFKFNSAYLTKLNT